eukprot:Nk52_evm87s207 gene=Nk52_evmTU87s207
MDEAKFEKYLASLNAEAEALEQSKAHAEEMSQVLERDPMALLGVELLDILTKDLTEEICFEVHRKAKIEHLFSLSEDGKKAEIKEIPGLDIFGQKRKAASESFLCINCGRSVNSTRFAPHLEKCMGMGRNSSRIASKRIATIKKDSRHALKKQTSSSVESFSSGEEEEHDDLSDQSWQEKGRVGRKPKRQNSKNKWEGSSNTISPRPPAKPRSRSVSISSEACKQSSLGRTMSGEKGKDANKLSETRYRRIFAQQCGVVSGITGKMCAKSMRCPQHTDLQRQAVRDSFLGPSSPGGETLVENEASRANTLLAAGEETRTINAEGSPNEYIDIDGDGEDGVSLKESLSNALNDISSKSQSPSETQSSVVESVGSGKRGGRKRKLKDEKAPAYGRKKTRGRYEVIDVTTG